MPGPLVGVRVIEFAGIGPGPFCGMMLADHGADVIRIDRPGGLAMIEDATREFLNRSRRSIAIDLKSEAGIALARELCAQADGVFEGNRPGVMERLGLGPEPLLEDNPRLVYGRMTGWGQDGPYAQTAGHDINYIALSGALHGVGTAGGRPVPPINLVGDFGGGGMMLAFGMVAAILHARASGQGQVIDCAMTEGSAILMALTYSLHAQGKWSDRRGENLFDSGTHYYNTYRTADDGYISLGSLEPQFYRELLERLGLSDDPDFRKQNDPKRWPALKERLDAIFARETRAYWCGIFEGSNVCFAPVMSMAEAPRPPHNVARRAFVEVNGATQPAPAPRFSKATDPAPTPMAVGDMTTASVLSDFGITEDRLQALRAAGTVI